MASYQPHEGGESNSSYETMYARLNAAKLAQQQGNGGPDYSRFGRGSGANSGYFSQADSPMPAHHSDYPLPAAPTPPSNFPPQSHYPIGASNLGPIGSSASNGSKTDQSNNLLNLLKFSGSQAAASGGSQPSPTSGAPQPSFDDASMAPASHSNDPPTLHAPIPMPADPQGLLATLMQGNHLHSETPGAPEHPSHAPEPPHHGNNWNTGAPSNDTQAYLLNLLHRPKPSQTDQPSVSESPQATALTPPSANDNYTDHSREHTQLSQYRADDSWRRYSPQDNADEYTSPASNGDGPRRFHNPFDDVSQPSPHNRTPKSTATGASGPMDHVTSHVSGPSAFQILKKSSSNASSPGTAHQPRRTGSYRSSIASPEVSRWKAESSPKYGEVAANRVQSHPASPDVTPESAEHKETVAEAMGDLADKADHEAQEALAAREEVRHDAARHLKDMINAETDAQFQQSAEVAAQEIKAELETNEKQNALEETYSPKTAQAIHDVVEDVAQGQVAENWESADADVDDIVVIEEDPVKVFNFPMKPWISITMQSTDELRPQFRDEVVLDIARLRKEFDQIDRNLVTATENYMVYGMSKQGGLRVIRQDDGRDAKLFTDTKDRIFNVAMSSSSSDPSAISQESIIGTGISGTVYYVQIKDGVKDHLEDDHPEQFGFALPPISSQEGDAPGGVLKTRAKVSSNHPEYFAVGRGKTISIVWPAYVMRHNIFKPGHNRVVDTERLSKECSLRINTGKAGKDFTFSQDDTTIVSLDKSGRVKFWDVRDLTAFSESGDSSFPAPAHTCLEVKEPMMTLNTTPEGEKAWPTSVLLLDKQRPYQKRGALRYMIVGMKQNHTLQLWDLALGKPVQEFNLPHSKESDAVCSVMYHPPSGMIVVGHPTRNSIYFLHLSAPKYTVKNLSQVEYIQKLVAKDASIPEPDSTAVISGVREYSFSNKGVLRSVDLLVNPASSANDADEPTLFELYSMHSKGVTGIWVKQHELGWSKDNKVLSAVDASEAGLVKIAKLKELPSAVVTEPLPSEDPTPLPVRIAVRTSQKDATPPQAASSFALPQEQSKKSNDNLLASIIQSERKETEPPVTPANQTDKSEKKARKKREKAAAADKLAAENGQSNGNAPSPRVGPISSKNADAKNGNASQSAISSDFINSAVQQIESSIGERVSGIISNELRNNRDQIENDFGIREQSFRESQAKLLELVSNVLSENVQAVLTRLVSDQFEDAVVPLLQNHIVKAVTDTVDNKVAGRVSHSVQNQMQKMLPNAVSQALQKPELAKAVSDRVANSVAYDMEQGFQKVLLAQIAPAFNDMAVAASRSAVEGIEAVQRQSAERIQALEQRHLADDKKIDQLTTLVTRLSDTVSSMASTQAQFQDGFLKMQQQLTRDRGGVAAPPAQAHVPAPSSQASAAHSYQSPSVTSNNQLVPFGGNGPASNDSRLQPLISNISSHLERGNWEAGLVCWLQGEYKHEVFERYLSKCDPRYLQDLPTLVSLSVGSVLSEQLESPPMREKITWLKIILNDMHSSLPHIDPQVREVVPNIMGQFMHRLDNLFMEISRQSPNDPSLKHIGLMINMSNDLKEAASHHIY